ncbi:hypothetical protein GO495_00715 [Chitinophaga oryziterrae]|uniref:Lipoprotein n=1 Tax=Chitinophaga oryziterrae TaxID=1031224 RepID=A0A6N8J4F2_9BACT|nr:hypothetical protein [Chitinophaga oryziterrae]MVT39089.1 hypothetical protein [Chitinophaga oryziterrae]
MKKTFIISLLTILLISCRGKVEIEVNPEYHGWIHIMEARKIKTSTYRLKPDKYGIVYLPSENFDKKSNVLLFSNGKKITDNLMITSYPGEYYPSSATHVIRYLKFYFPLAGETSPAPSKNIPDNQMKSDISLEDLQKKGKLNTALLW